MTFVLTVAFPSVDRVAIVAGHTALTVRPCCQVPTVLAHTAVHTPAVTITLTRCEEITQTQDRIQLDANLSGTSSCKCMKMKAIWVGHE